MMNQFTVGILAALAVSTHASASIVTYTHDSSLIEDDTNNANFNGLVDGQSLFGYQEDGVQVSSDRDYFSWNAPGLDGSEMFYASTGSLDLVDISLVSGGGIGDIEMEISSGWSPNAIGMVYLWVQLYDNGGLVEEFDFDSTSGDYVGIAGGGFDQVRIGAYASASLRDAHNSAGRNAIAIDNISIGTYVPVPAPGTLVISASALIGLRRRRA